MWVTDHPYLTAGGVLVGGILFIALRSGGGGGGATMVSAPVDPSVVGAGMQIQAMQMQLQSHSQDLQAQLQSEAEKNAVMLAVAKIQADQQTVNMNLQTALAREGIAVQREGQMLSATIATQQIDTQRQAMQLQHADTQSQIAATLEQQKQSNALMSELQKSNAALTNKMIDSQTTVQLANTKKQSWVSKIFGM